MQNSLGDRSFLFVLGSARAGGNTEALARAAADQLPPSVPRTWLSLSDGALPPFDDLRHAGVEWPAPSGPEQQLLDATLAATDVVLATPTYWYTVSASTKLYLDHWSGWMRLPGVDFKARMAGKTLWTVSVLSDEPQHADALVDTLRRCADYMGMRWGGALLGNGSRPGDIHQDTTAMSAAKTFFAA